MGASRVLQSRWSQFLALWIRFFVATPVSIFRLLSSSRRRSFCLSVVGASWGKRWFLGISVPTVEKIENLRYRTDDFMVYESELLIAREQGQSSGSSLPDGCACADKLNHKRLMELLQSDSSLFCVSVTLDPGGQMVTVDGLRRIAVALAQGRTEILARVVVPVKMLTVGAACRAKQISPF